MKKDVLEKQLTLITGKGGVGKSVLSALLAARFARSGQKTLLCELCSHKERLAPLFGQPSVGPQVTSIAPNLWCVNITPKDAMREYALLKVKIQKICNLFFENELVQSLIDLVPGLYDLVMLGKVLYHAEERKHRKPVWERIVVDAPATGHGIPFFRLPRSICEAVQSGNLYEESSWMQSLLDDPKRTAIHLVTLPEYLPVSETCDLYRRLHSELESPLGALFINRMPSMGLDETEKAQIRASNLDPAFRLVIEKGFEREATAEQNIKPLFSLPIPHLILPEISAIDFGPKELERLLEAFERALESSDGT